MRKIIKMVGKYNDLELGYIENNTYFKTGLLEDSSHAWKILEWINQNLEDRFPIRVIKIQEDLMDESQRENKSALDKIVKGAFRNTKRDSKTRRGDD